MAKRFVDTELDDKAWFMDLSCRLKCAVQFLYRKCDVAGVWTPNYKIASAYIGEGGFSEPEVLDIDNGNQFEKLPNGKIFVKEFCDFQYGSLSENCKPHRPVIEKLKKYGLYERVLKGYQKVIENLEEKDKDKEKDKEQEKEKEKDFGKSENLLPEEKFLIPEMSRVFKKHNTTYLPNTERDYKPLLSIATFLCEQGSANGPPENNAEEVLIAWEPISQYVSTDKFYSQKSLSTISNHIQELTQKALYGDQSTSKKTGNAISDDKLKYALSKRLRK